MYCRQAEPKRARQEKDNEKGCGGCGGGGGLVGGGAGSGGAGGGGKSSLRLLLSGKKAKGSLQQAARGCC